ncbi:MAG: two-component sensor histidine kinase [Microcoleus vaginatus WJT46-NPBG5]|jgi:signal transduction histidine kinase|nr:two-component sensor histidine kinase [Microcoleus vaginatus WJT46-NPBG5]
MPNLSGLLKQFRFTEIGPTSFRRILLSRILLLSVPVLLLGEYVTYRKARSGLLETARQNLSESAVRKGERIQDSIKALQAGLITASETTALQSGSLEVSKQFLEQLAQQLPTPIQCIQLTNVKTGAIEVSTCGVQSIGELSANLWPQRRNRLVPEASDVRVTALLPNVSQEPLPANQTVTMSGESKLSLLLSAPVYDQGTGELRYALRIQSALLEPEKDKPRSLSGYTVVIGQDGTILNHPNASRVGRNIQQEKDAERLRNMVGTALNGKTDFGHLFGFENKGVELLAGYTAIPSPITNDGNQKWIVLAITRLDNALAGLEEIQHVLVTLILGLLAANLLATVYLSRDLARPLEKLGYYALTVEGRRSLERVPHNFKIKEFNQLAESLDSMVERLTAWAEELETAWKEAKIANELKNEFLANTSHELRTPLNAIIGCIRLVRDDCCDDEEEEMEFLQRADDAAIHLLDIINDVLDIAKIEAGTLSVITEPVDLPKLLREVVDLQQSHIQQKGLRLNWHEHSETVIVEADTAKLKQVLLNVVGNAIKFTDTGSITLTTRIEPCQSTQSSPQAATSASSLSESRVIVAIQDTGIGIDPNQQHRLFQPFVMVDGKRTRKHGGTGLGLAISRNLVELMKGSITLHSTGMGQGTTVEIALPLMDKTPSPSPAAEKKTEETQPHTGHADLPSAASELPIANPNPS